MTRFVAVAARGAPVVPGPGWRPPNQQTKKGGQTIPTNPTLTGWGRRRTPACRGFIDVSDRARTVWWHEQVLLTPAAYRATALILTHVLLAGRIQANEARIGGAPVLLALDGPPVWLARTPHGLVLTTDPAMEAAPPVAA